MFSTSHAMVARIPAYLITTLYLEPISQLIGTHASRCSYQRDDPAPYNLFTKIIITAMEVITMCNKCNVSRRTMLKTTVGMGTGLVLGASSLLRPQDMQAEIPYPPPVAQPTIYSTSDWGAQDPREPIDILDHRPNKILIHHTDTPNTDDVSRAHAFQLARNIQQSHFARGWRDSGHHFLISRGGYIMVGRHRSLPVLENGNRHVLGAHCDGENPDSIGIENEGRYGVATPPQALYNRLVHLCAYICQQYSISPSDIYGHRRFDATICPGDRFTELMPRLREDVRDRLNYGS
jgi:hypothetical protein